MRQEYFGLAWQQLEVILLGIFVVVAYFYLCVHVSATTHVQISKKA